MPDVSAVCHVQAPRGSEVFVHRSGRSARAGREGQSIAFVSPADVAHWRKVYKAVGIKKEGLGLGGLNQVASWRRPKDCRIIS